MLPCQVMIFVLPLLIMLSCIYECSSADESGSSSHSGNNFDYVTSNNNGNNNHHYNNDYHPSSSGNADNGDIIPEYKEMIAHIPQYGKVIGRREEGVDVWRGIPYAGEFIACN